MDDQFVSLADLESFMLATVVAGDPESKKTQRTAKAKAARVWEHLLERVRDGEALQSLVVVCPRCHQDPDTCTHYNKLFDGGKKWSWNTQEPWVIRRDTLLQLTDSDLLGYYLFKATREHIMNFVKWLKSEAEI